MGMFIAENRKKAKGKDIGAIGKELGAMWKKLSDKDKKPYVDKAIKAKADHEAYLKSAAGLKVIGEYNAALKPAKEKLMKLKRPPAKAKSKKLSQLSSIGIGISIAMLIGFLVSAGLSR